MGSGGARKGAGRPKGQGKYKEPTKPVRIPESMITDVMKYLSVKGYEDYHYMLQQYKQDSHPRQMTILKSNLI